MATALDDLIKLREQVLEQTLPLLGGDAIPAVERFRLTLQLARTKGDAGLYQQAFQIAQGIEGEDKLNAYSELLSAIDTRLVEETENDDQGSSEEPSTSGQENSEQNQ